jgi:hypothetical protein
MKISNDGTTYTSELAYATSYKWTLSSGYGTKTVFVLFKDASGNWMTTPTTDTIQYRDASAPTGSVVINAGATTTTTAAVTLSLSASDTGGSVTGMKISNNGSTYTSELAYATSYCWTLSSGYGTKTVSVLFKDASGNWMTKPVTDTIRVVKATSGSGGTTTSSGSSGTAAGTTTTSSGSGTKTQAVSTADAEAVAQVKPVIVSPENNAADVALRPVIRTTDLAESYSLTEWEISNDNGDVLLDLVSGTQRTELTVPDLVLDAGMTHYCRVKFYDAQNNATEWSDPVSFDTVQVDPADLNANGIPDDQELLAGELVDLDKDGVFDCDQNGVKTLVTAVGDEYVSLKMSTNCRTLHSFKSFDPALIADTADRPGELPIGLIDFKVEVVNPGDFAEVVVNLAEPAPQGAQWYFYDETNGWRAYPHVAFSEDRRSLTIQLKDGDPNFGDSDGVANGIIIDPSGLGMETVQQEASDAGDDGANGGLCFIGTTRHHASSQTAGAAVFLMLIILAVCSGYRKKTGS